MADITAGTLLADRYRLISRAESDLADIASWQATDQILDRPVRIAMVSGARAEDALSEARRAALVADPRIVRVIDAGSTDDIRYIVLEDFKGDDLSVLTSGRALAADQAQAIVGEAAAALEVARQRGVHHLALRPQSIRVHSGRVQVTGLGIDGTLNPGARGTSATSARADVIGLMSILFYATSGKWPFANLEAINSSTGVLLPERAEEVDGHPPSLATVAKDVPAELVELVDRTLSSKTAGPRTPGELVAALEPWAQITAKAPRMFDSVQDFVPEPGLDFSASTNAHKTDQSTAAASKQSETKTGSAVHNLPQGNQRTSPVVRQSIRSTLSGGVGRATLPGTPPPAVPTTEPGRVRRHSVLSGPAAVSPISPAGAVPAQPVPTSSSPIAPAVPKASSTPVASQAGPAAIPPAGTYPAWAPVQQPQSQPNKPATKAASGSAQAPSPMKFEELMSAPSEYRRFRFNPTALTLVLALSAILVGVPIALSTLSSGFTNPFASKDIARPLQPGETPTAQDPGATEEPTTQEAIAPVIASGQAIDPPDNDEHPEAVDLAFDEDPSTYWFTRTYQSATYAGMGKSGIGFAVTLKQAAPVSTVYLSTNNTGGNVEVRATDPKNPTKGKVLASKPLEAELILDLSETVETEHIVLWFTELPVAPDGQNRVELREITLT